MMNAKDLDFDLFMPRMNAQTQKRVFDLLTFSISTKFGISKVGLGDAIDKRLAERTFGMGDGISVFDLKTSYVKRPIMAICSFEHKVNFDALDGQPVDVMAALISPLSDGPKHLQKLSMISRAMRSQELCTALRDANDQDMMRALFMPSQDWMIAA